MNHQLIAAAVAKQKQDERADPLRDAAPAADFQENFVEWVCKGLEAALRCGNLAGKTTIGAMLGVALARGDEELFGHKLPRLEMPAVWWVLSRTYKQQVESVQRAYRQWIGNWPHEIAWEQRAKEYIAVIRVKPRGWNNDDPNTWSRIVFVSQEASKNDADVAKGVRLDGVHADEPPYPAVWQELRKARKPGREFVKYITFTPLRRDEWEWIKQDFDGTENSPRNGRVEVRGSVLDNRFLSYEEKRRLIEDYENDPLKEARINGDYINVEGANPFIQQWDQLLDLEARSKAQATRREMVEIVAEDKDNHIVPLAVEVEILEDPDPAERYFVVGDPSLGVDDKFHDPCGMLIGSRRRQRIVLRYNGFCGAYGLGTLMAKMGERYNNATADPDVTGGYGGPTLRALRDYKSTKHPQGYRNINKERRWDTASRQWKTSLGFSMNEMNKAEMIESIRVKLRNNSIDFVPMGTLKCLKEAILDDRERLDKPQGVHYEDLVCLGHWAFLTEDRSAPKEQTPKQRMEEMLKENFGRAVKIFDPKNYRRSVIGSLKWH